MYQAAYDVCATERILTTYKRSAYGEQSFLTFQDNLDMFSKVKSVVNLLRFGRSSSTKTASSNEQTGIVLKTINESIIIDRQRTESNEEDVTIVWLSKNPDDAKEQSLMGSTRSINDYIQVGSFQQLCLPLQSIVLDLRQ